MEHYIYKDEDELYHHGVTGQKWGVRRYQNKDGSLTPAGQKHRTLGDRIKEYKTNKKRKAALEKARETRKANQEAAKKRAEDIKKGKIKSKDMTEDELNKRIARLQLEKNYNDAVKESKQVGMGSRFTSKFKESLVDKLADNVGADLISQLAKGFGAKAINSATKDIFGGEVVYTNNKKKN